MATEYRGTKALELWAQKITENYPGASIRNMTTSWRNGLAFCALIHHFRPDLIDFASLRSENILENNQLAFRIAEQHFGIPILLDAEDMVQASVPDKLSILTYLSQIYQAFNSLGIIGANGKCINIVDGKSSIHSHAPEEDQLRIILPKSESPLAHEYSTSCFEDEMPSKIFRERDICIICSLPVFLAEKVIIGTPGSVLHRACFRCLHCSTQLTAMSYRCSDKVDFSCLNCFENNSLGKSSCSRASQGNISSIVNEDSVNIPHDLTSDIEFVDSSKSHTKILEDASKLLITSGSSEDYCHPHEMSENLPDLSSDKSAPTETSRHKNSESSKSSQKIRKVFSYDDISLIRSSFSSLNPPNFDNFESLPKIQGSSIAISSKINAQNRLVSFTSNPEMNSLNNELYSTKIARCDQLKNLLCELSFFNKKEKNDHSLSSEIASVEQKLEKANNSSSLEDPNDKVLIVENTQEENKGEDESNFIKIEVEDCTQRKDISTIDYYPDELNPFDSGDEGEIDSSSLSVSASGMKKEDSFSPLNPFESDEELSCTSQVNTNPFFSVSDDSGCKSSLESLSSPLKTHKPPRPPPPTKQLQSSSGVGIKLKKKSNRAPAPPKSSSILGKNLDSPVVSEYSRLKKGPAPPRPVPRKRAVQKLPLHSIQQELEDIEIKQSELERQGVLIETSIREISEKSVNPHSTDFVLEAEGKGDDECHTSMSSSENSEKSCQGLEELILRLFNLVNEKNELFRRQAELMFLKREKRLEEEYAELEFQIRCLMMKPRREKTEEEDQLEVDLINRLVTVVEERNEVVNSLELERMRGVKEDESITSHLNHFQENTSDVSEKIQNAQSAKIKSTEKKKKKTKTLNMLLKGKKKTLIFSSSDNKNNHDLGDKVENSNNQ